MPVSENNSDEACENDGTTANGGEETWDMASQMAYDPADGVDLTTVIVETIAEAEGVPITAVRSPPLYERADVESIEKTLFSRTDGALNSTLEFRYNDYEVHVEADGWVSVWHQTDDESNRD